MTVLICTVPSACATGTVEEPLLLSYTTTPAFCESAALLATSANGSPIATCAPPDSCTPPDGSPGTDTSTPDTDARAAVSVSEVVFATSDTASGATCCTAATASVALIVSASAGTNP